MTTREPPEAVRAAVAAILRRRDVPGLSLAVVSQDRVLMAGGYGWSDLGSATPTDARTSYLWFSMTKVATATAALHLADEGRLDLEAEVTEYLPSLQVPGPTQPTVRQLLSHTAGLGNPLPIRWAHAVSTDPPDQVALLRRAMQGGRIGRYPAGRSARYSNVGYLLLGEVIAAASGQPFESYVTQSVLRPAGMMHTGFGYPAGAPRATGYLKAPRVADALLQRVLPPGVAGRRHGRHLALNPFYVDGPAYGGLVGSVVDAGRFLRLHLGDGAIDGQRVLEVDTARSMRRIDHPGRPFNHGLGWFRRPHSPQDCVEHLGTGVGFWNIMRLYPDRGLGVVIMSNTTAGYDVEPLLAVLAGTSW